ncbi:MAG: type II secretion system GspH family protein, partial [Acidobacteria bacterium]|nr:type II secretion system GspH family protein [Acidobacteriota bacterium]
MTNQGRAAAQAGFTLVEVMVVLLIFMIIAGAVFAAISAAQVRYRAEKQFLDSFQGARIGVDLMARDIHNAGYPSPYTYPGNFPKLPAGPTPIDIPDPVPWEVPT